MNVGDIIEGVDGGAYVVIAREPASGAWQVVSFEAWQLTEGYEFEVGGIGFDKARWRIVPDDGGEYGCRALRVD